MTHRLHRGVTALELLVGIAVLAILVGITVPGLGALFERLRLTGVANEMASDLQYARSEAVRRRSPVTLQSLDDGAGYEIVTGGVQLKVVDFPAGLTLADGARVDIDALRGTSIGDPLDLSNGAGTMRLNVGLMGRVTLCAAEGTLPGYPAC